MSGTLRIERLALRYRLSPRHPAPALAQADLDRDLRERLPASCATSAAASVPDGDGLIVIRSLDLRIGLLAGADPGRRLGTLCARAISRGVVRALAGELGPDRVARYASRAEYWASFVFDLARGAAGRWQYASLERLQDAPVGLALREASDSRVPVAAVLTALAERHRLGQVAAAIAEPDAVWLLDALEPAPGMTPPPSTSEVLAALAEPAAARLAPAALALFLAGTLAARRTSERLDAHALMVLRAAATVAVARRSLPAAAPAAGPAHWLRRGPEATALATLERAAPELAARLVAVARPAEVPPAEEDVTPFGGVFLLLPALAGLDGRERLTATGRVLVLAKCLPPESRAGAWYDRALGLAAGSDHLATLADLRALGAPPSRRSWAAWAAATLAAFARRLPGFERSSPEYLARNFLLGAATYRVDEKEGVRASLPQVPLRLVLRMSGWAGSEHLIPWLPGGRLLLGHDQ